jgi:hypothetical protein
VAKLMNGTRVEEIALLSGNTRHPPGTFRRVRVEGRMPGRGEQLIGAVPGFTKTPSTSRLPERRYDILARTEP